MHRKVPLLLGGLLLICWDLSARAEQTHQSTISVDALVTLGADEFPLISHQFIVSSGKPEIYHAGRFALTMSATSIGDKVITLAITLTNKTGRLTARTVELPTISIIEGRVTAQQKGELRFTLLGSPANHPKRLAQSDTFPRGTYVAPTRAGGGSYTFKDGGEMEFPMSSDVGPLPPRATGRYAVKGDQILMMFDESARPGASYTYQVVDGIPSLLIGGKVVFLRAPDDGLGDPLEHHLRITIIGKPITGHQSKPSR